MDNSKETTSSPESKNDLSTWKGVFDSILGWGNLLDPMKNLARAVLLNETNA